MDQITLFAFVAFALVCAGAVKGAVGMGLPTTAVGILTLVLDARTAIGLALVPMLVSNAWQFWRAGDMARAIRTYLPFVVTLVLGVSVTFAASRSAPEGLLLGALGLTLLAYVAINVTRWAPYVPARLDRPAQIVAGSVAGMMGGLVGVWATPMALYLAARGTRKDEFIRASGLMLCVGSVPLLAGYLQTGFLPPALWPAAAALLLPTFLGLALGERLRRHLSERAFRNMLLLVFVLMGLNLLRRAIGG